MKAGLLCAALLVVACQTRGGQLKSDPGAQPRRPDLEGLDEDLKLTPLDGEPAKDDMVAAAVDVPAQPGSQAGLALRATLMVPRAFLFGRLIARPEGMFAEIVRVAGEEKTLLARSAAPVGAKGTLTFAAREGALALYLDGALVAAGVDAAPVAGLSAHGTARGPMAAAVSPLPVPEKKAVARTVHGLVGGASRVHVYEDSEGRLLGIETDADGRVSARLDLRRSSRAGLLTGVLDAVAPSGSSCQSRHAATLRAFADGSARLVVEDGDGCAAARRPGVVAFELAPPG